MEKVVRKYTKKIVVKDVIYLCDRCGCQIDDPKGYTKVHNYIILDSNINYLEHEGCEDKFELCEGCYGELEVVIKKEIKNYGQQAKQNNTTIKDVER